MKKIFFLFLFTQFIWGADSKSTEAPKTKNSMKYKKNVNMEFEGRSVDGNVVSPDSADVQGDKNIKFDALIDGRKDFKREFKRSSGVSR